MEAWLQELLRASRFEGQAARRGGQEGQEETQALNLHHLQPAFFIVMVGFCRWTTWLPYTAQVGLAAGQLVFLLEILFFAKMSHKDGS